MAGTTSIVTTNAPVYAQKFRFQVDMDGVTSAAFKSCTGIKVELEIAEILQGGALLPDKQTGKGSLQDITLERGAFFGPGARDLYDLLKRAVNTVTASGENDENLNVTFDIVQLLRDGKTVARRHRVVGLVKSFESGDWDDSSDIQVEKIVIAPIRMESFKS